MSSLGGVLNRNIFNDGKINHTLLSLQITKNDKMIRKRKESEHMSSLFRKKDINDLVKHASPLKRTLKTWDLTF